MRETLKNIKTIYKFGKEYRGALILEAIGSFFGIVIGIALPILSAQLIVHITDNN